MSKAQSTRRSILQKSFDLIYERGYQSTSIDEIIATTQVTKGAFFYHFKNKEAMGLSVINELVYADMVPLMGDFLKQSDDFRGSIFEMIRGLLQNDTFFKVEYGCPVINMIDEMAPLSPDFRSALDRVVVAWQSAIESVLLKAQEQGQLGKQHDVKNIALYVIASYGGARSIGKVFGKASYASFLTEFEKYLKALG